MSLKRPYQFARSKGSTGSLKPRETITWARYQMRSTARIFYTNYLTIWLNKISYFIYKIWTKNKKRKTAVTTCCIVQLRKFLIFVQKCFFDFSTGLCSSSLNGFIFRVVSYNSSLYGPYHIIWLIWFDWKVFSANQHRMKICSRSLHMDFSLRFLFFKRTPDGPPFSKSRWRDIRRLNENSRNYKEWKQIWRNKVYLRDKSNQRLLSLSWSGCCFQRRYVFHVVDPFKPPSLPLHFHWSWEFHASSWIQGEDI